MTSPTGERIRSFDGFGSGRYGAPRGKRKHRGSDFGGKPGQDVVCPINNALVVRECRPYAVGEYSGVILRNDDFTLQLFYFLPNPEIYGTFLNEHDVMGTMQDISLRYPIKKGQVPMMPHVHLGILNINPEIFLRLP